MVQKGIYSINSEINKKYKLSGSVSKLLSLKDYINKLKIKYLFNTLDKKQSSLCTKFINTNRKELISVHIVYNILLRTVLTTYWSASITDDLRALYGADFDDLEYDAVNCVNSKRSIIDYILTIVSIIPKATNSVSNKKSNRKLILDFNAFKGYKPKSKLTWKLLNFTTKSNNYKSELFFLKNVFYDPGYNLEHEDIELLIGIVYLISYVSYISYDRFGDLATMRVDNKSNLLELAAFSFRLMLSELITYFVEI